MAMALSDLRGHLLSETILTPYHIWENIARISYDVFTHPFAIADLAIIPL